LGGTDSRATRSDPVTGLVFLLQATAQQHAETEKGEINDGKTPLCPTPIRLSPTITGRPQHTAMTSCRSCALATTCSLPNNEIPLTLAQGDQSWPAGSSALIPLCSNPGWKDWPECEAGNPWRKSHRKSKKNANSMRFSSVCRTAPIEASLQSGVFLGLLSNSNRMSCKFSVGL
jgi:hypothetical protein